MAIVYLPMVTAQYLPLWTQKRLDLIPLVGSPTDIFRTNTFYIFGQLIFTTHDAWQLEGNGLRRNEKNAIKIAELKLTQQKEENGKPSDLCPATTLHL